MKALYKINMVVLLSFLFCFSANASNVKQVAKDVQNGKAPIGKSYSLDIQIGKNGVVEKMSRYHAIHAKLIGFSCGSCHSDESAPDALMVGRYREFSEKHPGPVDRSACLSCHRAGGPGKVLYGQTPVE